jgi:hypothetical protein
MESSTEKPFGGQFVRRRNCVSAREKPTPSRNYLELLAHYDAELVQIDGPITVRYKTGTELPLEQKGKLQMVKLLLEEFGTVDGANKAIENYKITHS